MIAQNPIVEIALTPPPAPVKPPEAKPKAAPLPQPVAVTEDIPEVNRISQLFTLDSSKLPIVETVSYTSRVPWLKDRPAWIADYASHYETSRHFIARSLNKKADYLTQKISPGDRFNVFKRDKNISFHLLIDLTRCCLWLYAIDSDANERYLLKTYHVGVGRSDPTKTSGFLTPTGKYQLGEKVAIYKPGTQGYFQDQKTEMIRVFGTRWIPFDKEVEGCTEPSKGFGLHGAPWVQDNSGQLVEDKSKIGKYDSDGCIRLASEDIEEIFAIVITKPTIVELVKDFRQAKLPGVER
ncbi:MAG: L,D-transpeptidase [Verrucomicrobia bacterium]|nr:L,D-transpeptidase [Verrucomicrobiota bacterium]